MSQKTKYVPHFFVHAEKRGKGILYAFSVKTLYYGHTFAAYYILSNSGVYTVQRLARNHGGENMTIKRGEVYYADLNPVVGSEQGGVRPVVVLQNDVGNKYSPTVIAAATTSRLYKAKLPTHIEIAKENSPLPKNSVVLLEQIRTIDKSRIKEKIGELPADVMRKIEDALLLSLGF